MLRWLVRNIGNILLSIILAAVVWVIAVNEANPYREDVFRSIPIAFVNQPPDTIVYDLSATTVDVWLRAPETAWDALSPRVISATVDMGGQMAGDEPRAISVGVPDPIVRVARVDPPVIRFKHEPLGAAQVPVTANLIGDPPAGYRIQRVVAQPALVTASGPASSVSRVAGAAGEFSVQAARAPVSETLTLKPLDAGGQVVPNVTLDPDRVLLTVNVEQLAGFRDVGVKIELTGAIASGYRLVEVNVTPQSVTVIGSPSALEALPGFVETETIDISGAQADVDKDALLNLPPGVTVYGQPSVRVSVKVEPIVGSLTLPSQPITVGLRGGLVARVAPESVDVILVGALPVLDSIDLEKDVRVILDLSALDVGTHQVEPRVETPEGIVAQSILPPTVQVIIERAPRGTPTPSPTPRPTPR